MYDPYYCDGSVVHRLNALGFKNVYNKCEDFYVKFEADEIPEHDILITNPPYSGDHMERIIRFCSKANKPVPWLVLMPHFVSVSKHLTLNVLIYLHVHHILNLIAQIYEKVLRRFFE